MVAQEPITLCPNAKIAGASDDVSRIYTTQEYAFDGFTIIVDQVPAYRDNETGVEYIPGGIAMRVSDAVMELVQQIQDESSKETRPERTTTWRRHFDTWTGGLLPA